MSESRDHLMAIEALERWYQSKYGKRVSAGATDGASLDRLDRAFLAGWDAAMASKSKPKKGTK